MEEPKAPSGPPAVTTFWRQNFGVKECGRWTRFLLEAFVFSVKSLAWIKATHKLQQQRFAEGCGWTRCPFARVKWQWREEKLRDVFWWGITMLSCLVTKTSPLFLLNISVLRDRRLGGALRITQSWCQDGLEDIWTAALPSLYLRQSTSKATVRWQGPVYRAKRKNCKRHLTHRWY